MQLLLHVDWSICRKFAAGIEIIEAVWELNRFYSSTDFVGQQWRFTIYAYALDH